MHMIFSIIPLIVHVFLPHYSEQCIISWFFTIIFEVVLFYRCSSMYHFFINLCFHIELWSWEIYSWSVFSSFLMKICLIVTWNSMFSLVGYLFAAYIPHYLYPLLNIMNKEKPYEHLRLTSLGVLGAIVKVTFPSLQ